MEIETEPHWGMYVKEEARIRLFQHIAKNFKGRIDYLTLPSDSLVLERDLYQTYGPKIFMSGVEWTYDTYCNGLLKVKEQNLPIEITFGDIDDFILEGCE